MQRLAIFLDGTWNTQDDNTNVRQLFSLTREGICSDGVVQKNYYDPGVGTGVLDKISGGGFGKGLQENVRQAYNWLVNHYQQGDQIFVFGFSRGAFTARSLVGFLAACGLLERGAPLTVTQLWERYEIISRKRLHQTGLFRKPDMHDEPQFLRISSIERHRDNGPRGMARLTETERLLARYSSRRDIQFVGIFDTVAALGWDALGIPWLKSRLARNHDPYPSGIMRYTRHALAIDEHRINFDLTPYLHYRKHGTQGREASQEHPNLEQRWFAGAHSNIGGGYRNNVISRAPLLWVLDGARQAGLVITHPSPVEPDSRVARSLGNRDSFAEFASPWWVHMIRSKRLHRVIDRTDLVTSSYALQTINETIDDSVAEYARENPDYAPINLITWLKANKHANLEQALANRKPGRFWPERNLLNKGTVGAGENLEAWTWLLVWSGLAAVGLDRFLQILSPGIFEVVRENWLWLAFPFMFILADWFEHRINHSLACGDVSIRSRTLRQVLRGFRLTGLVMGIVAMVVLVLSLISLASCYIGWCFMTLEPIWGIDGSNHSQPRLAANHLLLLEGAGIMLWWIYRWTLMPLGSGHIKNSLWKKLHDRERLPLHLQNRDRLAAVIGIGIDADDTHTRQHVCRAFRESLWRENLGLIPILSWFLLLIISSDDVVISNWSVTSMLFGQPASNVYLYCGLALWIFFDLIENRIHLGNTDRFESGTKFSILLIGCGYLATGIKLILIAAFALLALYTGLVLVFENLINLSEAPMARLALLPIILFLVVAWLYLLQWLLGGLKRASSRVSG